jgi:predicted metal-dependent enzyme (double-stranded beta helix superfamily)
MKTRNIAAPVSSERCFGDLISGVRAVTRRRASWAKTADLVASQLRLRMPGPDILTAEQRYGDPTKYCCHLLHSEPDGGFSIVALVWRPGQATPIHDHVAWCVSGVIQGAERETRYLLSGDGWLEEAATVVSVTGDVSSLAPPGDIHSVHNDGADAAISLHIYGTDVSRLGSSVRRVYDLPVVSGSPG